MRAECQCDQASADEDGSVNEAMREAEAEAAEDETAAEGGASEKEAADEDDEDDEDNASVSSAAAGGSTSCMPRAPLNRRCATPQRSRMCEASSNARAQ